MKAFLLLVARCGVVVLLLGAGCTKQARQARHREKAREHLAAGRYEQAMIEGVNAYRLGPEDPESVRILALAQLGAKQFGPAIPTLRRGLELRPDDLELRLALAPLLYATRNLEEARVHAEYVLQRQPSNLVALQLWCATASTPTLARAAQQRLDQLAGQINDQAFLQMLRGQLALAQNDLDTAEQALRAASDLDPEQGVSQLTLGELYWRRGRTNEALVEMEKAAQAGARFPQGAIRWAEVKRRQGDLTESKRILESLVQSSPDNPEALLQLAGIEASQGETAEALARLDNLIGRWPNFLPALDFRARVRWSKGDADAALTELRALTKKHPRHAPFHFSLGTLLSARRQLQEAVASLKTALTLDPAGRRCRLTLADAQLRSGEAAEAIETLRGLREELTNSAGASLLLGRAYMARRDLGAALGALGRASMLASNSPAVHIYLGQALVAAGRRTEARLSLEKALSLNPRLYAALGLLAETIRVDGSLAEAVARVRRAQEGAEEAPEPWLILGDVYSRGRSWSEAEGAYRKALGVAPSSLPAMRNLAQIYQATGRPTEAAALYDQALVVDPKNVRLLGEAGVLHQEFTHDTAKARAYYEKALELQPNQVVVANNLATLLTPEDLDRALVLARRAVEAAPGNAALQDTLGWILHLRGESVAALKSLGEAAAQATNVAAILYHFGVVQAAVGQEREARATLDQALALGQTFSGSAGLPALKRVLALPPAEVPIEALRALTNADPLLVGYPPALYREAVLRERAGDSAASQAGLSNLVQRAPAYSPAVLHLARAKLAEPGGRDEALSILKRAHEAHPADLDVTLVWTEALMQSGDHRKARTLLEPLEATLGGNPRFLSALASAQCATGDLANAQKNLRAALRIAPDFAGAEAARAFMGMLDLAQKPAGTEPERQRIEAVLANQPGHLPARYALLAHYEKAGAADEVVRVGEALLRDYPDFFLARPKLGEALYGYGMSLALVDPFGARKALTRALELNPRSSRAEAARDQLRQLPTGELPPPIQ